MSHEGIVADARKTFSFERLANVQNLMLVQHQQHRLVIIVAVAESGSVLKPLILLHVRIYFFDPLDGHG